MADGLNVRVVHLKRAVVRTEVPRIHGKENGVMIDELFFPIDVHECSYMCAVGGGEDVGCFEVEIFCVEIVRRSIVLDQAE